MMEQFLTVLKGTILRVGSKEADENLESLEKISAASGLSKEGIEQHIYEVLRGIAKEKHRRGHKDQLKTSLEQYISANFIDANLNLSILADHFKLKESYIYFFFKNYMGTSFSGYLADIRLRKAITILTKDDRDIGEIAEAVGYANVQTFRRAFKKGTGLTPTEYRDAKREFTA
jgi:YesN/AraC family two-component response regulator